MFNNILIDGFKFYATIDEETYYSIKEPIIKALERHFFKNAYSISYKYNKLLIAFNPTRYFWEDFKGDDYNLDMPPEEELYKLFVEMGFYSMPEYLADSFIISLIHLAKNFLMVYIVIKYINHMRTRTFKKGFKQINVKSEKNNDTLTLATPDRGYDDSKAKDRKFIFYNKGRELKDKTNSNSLNIRLKSPLSEEEKAMIPSTACNEAGTSIRLDNLNILRFEQQYMHKSKLEPLARFLQGEDYKKGLKLSTFLELLKQGQLYKKLDEFYTKQAKEIVFFDEISQETPLSDEEELLKYLLNGVNGKGVDTSDLVESFSTESQKIEFIKTLKKVQSVTVDNEYYCELYKKIIGHQINL